MRKTLLCCAVLMPVLAVACNPPTAPTVIVTQTQEVGERGTTPTTTPSPSAGGNLPAGSRIAILMFGQTCPSGVTVPRNGTRECKMGCQCDFTCTPKGPDGTDLPEAVHGPLATWAVLAGAEHVQVSRAGFNLGVRPLSVGPFTLSCTVKDLTGVVDASVVSPAGLLETVRSWWGY